MSTQHTPESVYKIFQEINQGLCSNAIFSGTEVVMLSREYFDVLTDMWEEMQQNKSKDEQTS